MRKLVLLFLGVALIMACKPEPKGESAKVGEAKKAATQTGSNYSIDPASSVVKWEGSKLAGSHNGSLDISQGTVSVANGQVTGGKFTIDMTSLKNFDLPDDKKGKLVGHLLSPDFFDAEQYPTSKFEITKISKKENDPEVSHLVYGNLTIKDKTKEIGFPAKIVMANNQVQVSSPSFTIDRTDFGVQYGSKKVFTDLVKDKAIDDDVSLSVNLIARK